MRISLLLQREDFGRICERTLAAYLGKRFDQPFHVTWHEQPGIWARAKRGQIWFANIYLNAIYQAGASKEVFEPFVREFSETAVRWRRPLQRAYVDLAFSPLARRWLAQAWLEIAPGVDGADDWVIVPGNHKLRILDRQAGVVVSMLKDGFDASLFECEVNVRKMAEELGAPAPQMMKSNTAEGWFEERYVLGTPLNRLADLAEAERGARQIAEAMRPFYTSTLQALPMADYSRGVAGEALQCLERIALVDDTRRNGLREMIGACAQHLERWGEEQISTSLCHGDFQAANLLADGPRTWIIDWEYSRRCQAGYDALVYALDARSSRGLAGRLGEFVAGNRRLLYAGSPPGADWNDPTQRARTAWLFLMEELAFHLRENANPQFTRTSLGLAALEQEVKACLSMEALNVG